MLPFSPSSRGARGYRMKKLAGRFSLALLTLAVMLVLSTASEVRAGGCKSIGTTCTTDVSCCSRKCVKPAPGPGKARPMFGVCGCGPGQVVFNGACCTPRTCVSLDCGTGSNGCGGTLNCTCDACEFCEGATMTSFGECMPACAPEQCCGGTCLTTTTTPTTTTTTSVTTTTMGCSSPCGVCAECIVGECTPI